jgi:hypothetical protein
MRSSLPTLLNFSTAMKRQSGSSTLPLCYCAEPWTEKEKLVGNSETQLTQEPKP